MIDQIRSDDPIRRKIETLGATLSLPTVRKALGILEGAHASNKRFGADDVVDIHAYEPGDEAKRIDWKTSARAGRPMVVQRERPSTSKAWLLLDVGQEMTAACPSSEQAYQVAANALCMFAALSLRRGDEVSMVFGDSASITRVPFNGAWRSSNEPWIRHCSASGPGPAISTRCWNTRAAFGTKRRWSSSPPRSMRWRNVI